MPLPCNHSVRSTIASGLEPVAPSLATPRTNDGQGLIVLATQNVQDDPELFFI